MPSIDNEMLTLKNRMLRTVNKLPIILIMVFFACATNDRGQHSGTKELVPIDSTIVTRIGISLTTDEEPAAREHKNRQNRLDLIKAKIKALEKRVKNEIAQLKLTTEMENALSRKVDRICIALGVTFCMLIVLAAVAFYSNGFDIITSILSTAGLISLTCPLLSIILWRTVDFDSVVVVTRRKIKQWLNKKYGHNPDSIVVLIVNIVELNGFIENHNQELDTLLSPIPDNH